MTQSQEHSHPWYIGVCLWLAALTVVEVVLAMPSMRQGLASSTFFTLMAVLAVAKAGLVALYFMHLKFERIRLILFVSTPIVAVFLMLVVIYVDALRIVPW